MMLMLFAQQDPTPVAFAGSNTSAIFIAQFLVLQNKSTTPKEEYIP
ncbi:unnamed protein product [Scytosiphon promiscuus]